MSILDHFPLTPERFEPATVQQFTILEIARKLNDVGRLRTYLIAAEHHGLAAVISAYSGAIRQLDPRADFYNRVKQLSNL